ncbi:phosphopyruvate hydratase [bacterium]|nr:phosphopyruvate hydratase [bacterium]
MDNTEDYMRITSIQARQILDSRGNPTVECSLALADGKSVLASVPSGASTGSHEAHEVRDGGSLYRGKGVLHAIKNIEEIIAPALVGKAPDVVAADATMLALDGTGNCDSLGANAMLAVSVAVLRAQAATENLELFQFINQRWAFPAPRLPQCMFNLINGGMHAQGSLAFQEFLIMPQTGNFEEDLALADAVYYALKDLLEQKGRGSAVGDEGGFVPSFNPEDQAVAERKALDLLRQAIQAVGKTEKISIGIDAAATSFYQVDTGVYRLHGNNYKARDLIALYQDLVDDYALSWLEDPMAEDDWVGWQRITALLGGIGRKTHG